MSVDNFDIFTIVPALIGAIGGSFGGILISDFLRRKSEKEALHKNIVNNYLLQLQDALESLYYRLDNIRNKGGRSIMEKKYYEESTLYALGCALAYARILLVEGVYSQIEQFDPGLGYFLKDKLSFIGTEMDRLSRETFFRDKLEEKAKG